MKHSKKILFIPIILFSLMATNVFAGDKDFTVKKGMYLGLSFDYNSLPGDFDDSSFYYTSTNGYNVPTVDSGSGFGVIFGSRYTKGALELGYHRSTHDTNSLFVDIGKQDATYNLVDLNLKYDVFAKGKFRPNILLGVGYTWVTVNNSMTDGDNYSDETFTGGALNLGGGISYYLNPRWCINTEVIYRWQRYGRVEGVDLESALSGGGINYTIGIAYTF